MDDLRGALAPDNAVNVAVIGAGGWGTALSRVLAEGGHAVTLWAHRAEFAAELRAIAHDGSHENAAYLPGISIDPAIEITHEATALAGKDLYVFALPSQATREVALALSPNISRTAIYVSASKGIERG